jgi:hypothetical protein
MLQRGCVVPCCAAFLCVHTQLHAGATYGFQSIVVYFPTYDFTLAVASNIETDFQAQPSAGTAVSTLGRTQCTYGNVPSLSFLGLCFAFQPAVAVLTGKPVPSCTYTVGSYYSSGCTCKV